MTRANKTVYHPNGDANNFQTVEGTLDSLDQRVTTNTNDIATANGNISGINGVLNGATAAGQVLESTGSGGATNPTYKTRQEAIDFTIESPDNKDYLFEINCPYGYTITQVDSDCRAGTCTATTKIGGVALGGGANSVSTSLQSKTHASSNAIALNGTSVVTISANSSCEGLRLVYWITRT
jgi:hypothetical protein